MPQRFSVLMVGTAVTLTMLAVSPPAAADNKRLNDSVVTNVYTLQHHAVVEAFVVGGGRR